MVSQNFVEWIQNEPKMFSKSSNKVSLEIIWSKD